MKNLFLLSFLLGACYEACCVSFLNVLRKRKSELGGIKVTRSCVGFSSESVANMYCEQELIWVATKSSIWT